mmetsp:Transcript_22678/g.41042  ORF Transcript_22678/g.41042 Transcript_22678/m.41042 type:complete len:1608 (-) Transcript_22678:60-4883(-)
MSCPGGPMPALCTMRQCLRALILLAFAVPAETFHEGCSVDLEEEAELLDVRLLQTSLKSSRASRGQEDTVLLQTSLELAVETANVPSVQNASRQRQICSGLICQATPLLASRPLLVQLGTVELSQAVPSTPSTDFFLSDVTKLRICGILAAYFMLYLLSIASMNSHMTHVDRQQPKAQLTSTGRRMPSESCMEDETFSQSPLSWICVSWLNPLVARLGSSWTAAMSKCSPDELPQIGTAELQALNQGDRFEELWNAEVEAVGIEQASFVRVMIKMWTLKTLVWFTFLLSVHIVIGNLYAVLLVQKSLDYFFWLQEYMQSNGGQLPDLTTPVLLSMFCFSLQPMLNTILSSFVSSISMKFDQKLAGAAVMLFRKTQRLPAASLAASEAQEDDGYSSPNVMMVINNDIVGNFHGVCFSIACCFNSALTILILLVIMMVKLRLATLFCLMVTIPAVIMSILLSGSLSISMSQLQEFMDKRVLVVREILQGIRIVKSYAWEDAMENQVDHWRKKEMGLLKMYFKQSGNFVCLFNVFPRLLTFAGLWGFTHLYGTNDLATLFACLQILSSLRNESELFTSCLRHVITLGPSADRIERYLKSEEAPVLPGRSVPAWVHIWPAEGKVPEADASGASRQFKLHGTFSWSIDDWSTPVLHDLQLDMQSGEMLAITGSVGSGKSTLLEAALGELYPNEGMTAALSRPRVCAYCPQVPHIAEGTLRDNVVFGQAFDEVRYREALAASDLEKDLNLLPGGDGAFIGVRGISLSGGQRARLALARAAYHTGAELVLLDDPFAAVDAPTAAAIMEKLLLGPLMKGRTRLVVLQPEQERLKHFDRVIVLSEGRVVANGTPAEVAETDHFKSLLRSGSEPTTPDFHGYSDYSDSSPTKSPTKRVASAAHRPPSTEPASSLRESEYEGRPSWEMVKHYIGIGKWRNMFNSLLLFSLMLFLYLLCDLSLAHCINALSRDPDTPTGSYFTGYLFWLICGTFAFLVGWQSGQSFSLRISVQIHEQIMHRLLHAPIDRFFDKHPVGRIMNRLTTDLATIDLQLFMKLSGSVMVFFATIIPLLYIHAIMPWIVTFLALPFYYVVGQMFLRYQNAIVPLRYCMTTAVSHSNSCLSDVMANSVVVRGFGEEERLTALFAASTDDAMRASLTDERLLRRWLLSRVMYLWSFYNTTVYVIGLFNAGSLGAGTLGVCLTNLLMLETMLEPNLELMAGSLFELIALARVHEYAGVVQERAMRVSEDEDLRNHSVRYLRKQASTLTVRERDGFVEVLKDGRPLLQSSSDGRALVLAKVDESGYVPHLQDLCPSSSKLALAGDFHRISGANDATGSAKAIAEELCKSAKSFITASSLSSPPQVVLDLQSSWLAEGARLEVQSLRTGYADMPQDVLRGVSFCVEPKMKVGIVGTTGCGKSSLLLALLRIIEPRGGRVVINGVDTRDIGLATLRSSLGLVPQDPMLFSGTIRYNLDPFNQYTDGRIKLAVRTAHLEDFVKSLPLGLDYQIVDEGSNLSFGQRQLLCLARMVLRQPALLLLDEATSAIDPHTQESVQETIFSAFPSSTMLAVAHRLETIMEFDYVVVLDKGAVAEEGNVKEVAAQQSGLFKKMLQAKENW